MRRHPCSQDRFLNDVQHLEMTILRDEDVHRHVRFKQPGTTTYMFDLITWPGHLCYSGDMGTYVFSRIEDMFAFFRNAPRDCLKGSLYINPGYWSEKVLAADKHGKIEEYVEEIARRRLLAELREGVEDKAERREIYDAVSVCLDNEHDAREVFAEHFSDSWEWDLSDFTYSFIWCCYALTWGIQQYDAAKAEVGMEAITR